jgi:hypothetical protein
MTDFRARCKQHPKWRGEWRRYEHELENDLRAHSERYHPEEKNPKKAAKRGVKRIK